MALANNKDNKTQDSEQAETHSHLGNPTNPQAANVPTDHSAEDTVDPTATQVGSQVHLNAFRQDLQDEIAKAHQAVDEIAGKANAYVDRFQQG